MHDTGRGRLCTTGIQFSIFGSIRCLAVSNYFGSGDFQFVLLPPPQADSMTTRTALKLQIPAPPLGEMLMMMLDHLT